ncbi:MAG: tetratricopeptide repeat protein [Gammaproteobacteria bacterium]
MMVRRVINAFPLVAVALALGVPDVVSAQAEPPPQQRQEAPMYRMPGTSPEPDRTQRQSALTERTFSILTAAHEQIGNEQYQEAEARLQELLGRLGRSSNYERALVMQNLGYVYLALERYPQALQMLEQSLQIDALSHRETQDLFRMMGQLYAVQEQWRESLRVMQRYYYWESDPPADALLLMATAYAQLEDFRNGILWIQRAIQKSSTPRENWYQLWLAMHHGLREYQESADVLAQMIAIWPGNKNYWQQLAGLLWADLNREADALAVWSMAYRRGLLTEESEILNVVRGYMYRNAPYNGARVMRDAMEAGHVRPTLRNWELLSQAYQLSQENRQAISALQRAAALSDDGELYVREAQLHASADNWTGVQTAAANAIQKGGLRNPGRAWMMVGMAAYERKQYQEALRAFRSAAQHPDSSRLASQWIQHINHELRVARELREGI